MIINESLHSIDMPNFVIMNMKELTKDRATAIANELKSIVRKYDHRNFIAHIAYLANHHVRQAAGQINLRSLVRQLMYLVSLYHATEILGKELYATGTKDHRIIISLLNEIGSNR